MTHKDSSRLCNDQPPEMEGFYFHSSFQLKVKINQAKLQYIFIPMTKVGGGIRVRVNIGSVVE